jgi:mono/diheme cytochrome c family protein
MLQLTPELPPGFSRNPFLVQAAVSGVGRLAGLSATMGLLVASAVVLAQGAGGATYTAAQAVRGAALFTAKCAVCHGEELTGGPGTPPLKGPEFQFTWKGKAVVELVAFMREKMPPGGADTLTDAQYTDVIALMLQANELAPGASELSSDEATQAGLKLLLP